MRKGFNLIELVLSLGLVAILLGVVFWAVNPAERIKRTRDTRRIEDFEALQASIEANLSASEGPASTFGVPSSTVGVEVTREPDGSGWIPMDLSGDIERLPVDPLNGQTYVDVLGANVLGEYQYISDGKYYVLRTHLESEKNRGRYEEDGNDNSWWEVGNAPGMSTYFGL